MIEAWTGTVLLEIAPQPLTEPFAVVLAGLPGELPEHRELEAGPGGQP
jgi:hypothetical protein